jgi:hypothetical protein
MEVEALICLFGLVGTSFYMGWRSAQPHSPFDVLRFPISITLLLGFSGFALHRMMRS